MQWCSEGAAITNRRGGKNGGNRGKMGMITAKN